MPRVKQKRRRSRQQAKANAKVAAALPPGVQGPARYYGPPRSSHGFALTDALKDELIGYIAGGATIEEAAERCGIASRTVRKWRALGEENERACEAAHEMGEEPQPDVYGAFVRDFRFARGFAKGQLRMSVMAATSEDWKAAAWLLERLAPREYSPHMLAVASATVEAEGQEVDPTSMLLDKLGEMEVRLSVARKRGVVIDEDDAA